MSDCKAVVTPGEVNLKLVKSDDEEQKLVDPKLYRSLVGYLLFIGKQITLESSKARTATP